MEIFALLAIIVLLVVILIKVDTHVGDVNSLKKIFFDTKISVDNLSQNCARKQDLEEILRKIENWTEKSPAAQPLDVPQTNEQVPECVTHRSDEQTPDTLVLSKVPQESEGEVKDIQSETIKDLEPPVEQKPAYVAFNNTNSQWQAMVAEKFEHPSISQPPKEAKAKKGLIEKIFSENLLTKIGIITLVLGVAFFVKYAIDQDWINWNI